MVRELILETSFLVDLEREARREAPGAAFRFLEAEAESSLLVTFTIAGELAAGESLAERDVWDELLSSFRVLESNREVCWRYGELYRAQRRTGEIIGANDLWIAATALAYGVPVVTANVAHFGRVPGLEVVNYRDA